MFGVFVLKRFRGKWGSKFPMFSLCWETIETGGPFQWWKRPPLSIFIESGVQRVSNCPNKVICFGRFFSQNATKVLSIFCREETPISECFWSSVSSNSCLATGLQLGLVFRKTWSGLFWFSHRPSKWCDLTYDSKCLAWSAISANYGIGLLIWDILEVEKSYI